MTTQEFIVKRYNKKGIEKRFGSVMVDSGGYIYSYGYHYPLAFNVAGLDFVNNAGYSTTTSKHIGWAHGALNYNAISVKLSRGDSQIIASGASNADKLEVIRKALFAEHTRITDEMLTKKRKDTFVYSNLQRQASTLAESLKKVIEV